MSRDFRTVLISPAIIADITSEETFGVKDGPAQSSYQQFAAVSASNSQLSFNVQVPSEMIVIDREILLQTDLAFAIALGSVPVGQSCISWGNDTSLAAFPLNSLATTYQTTINNQTSSTNIQDILPMILQMYDKRELCRYNSLTPCYPDCTYGQYKDGLGANNSVMSAYANASYDGNLLPRGAFAGVVDGVPMYMQLDHYVNGSYANNHSPISTATTDTWILNVWGCRITEPFLALSPFTNCKPNSNAGLLGVNNMAIVLNIDSTCKRLISTAAGASISSTGITSYVTGVSLGCSPKGDNVTAVPVGFNNTRLLFNFVSLNASQSGKVAMKNVVPYMDYPRYLSPYSSTTAIAAGGSGTLTSQSIQLAQVPDLILICARLPMTSQNWNYSSSFLSVRGVSVNFNNVTGLLASATQADLFRISAENGSGQSWGDFCGSNVVINSSIDISGNINSVPSCGSLLVLDPVRQFNLPDYLSSSSLGQYQLQFSMQVYNQFGYSITPEICIVTLNSGIFVTQQGTSQVYTGIMTKEDVLNTKEQHPVPHLDTEEYARLVGGKLGNLGVGAVGAMMKRHRKDRKMSGGVESGGVAVGGVGIGGQRKSRLSRHLM